MSDKDDSSSKVLLRGITWGHSRGYTCLVGVSQRYSELHPTIEISWDKRSLKEFESKPLSELADTYDLLVIDHPWAGFAVKHGILLPLNKLFPSTFLDDQQRNSVGPSFASYNFDGFQSAFAIDAASPVSVWRPDKIDVSEVPRTFQDTLALAHGGKVLYAATPTYLLMDFYAFCATAGGSLFSPTDAEHVVDDETGMCVLEDMRHLASLCPQRVFSLDTIALHEELATSESAVFCPFVYGYVNYSRRGYARHVLQAGDVISYGGQHLKGVLGGTGLAISSRTRNPKQAAAFVAYAASGEMQRTIYCDCGGQPGHMSAWLDDECNRQTHDFFRATLPSLEDSYLRPRYSGYLSFQDAAGTILHEFVQGEKTSRQTLQKLNELYVASRRNG